MLPALLFDNCVCVCDRVHHHFALRCMLHCVAVCRIVLQCVMVCCSVLSTLSFVSQYGSTCYYVCCSLLQCAVV